VRNSARRAKYGAGMTTQAATHRLNEVIFGVDQEAEDELVVMKWEIEDLIDAVLRSSVVAADQGKILSVQIQFAQPAS